MTKDKGKQQRDIYQREEKGKHQRGERKTTKNLSTKNKGRKRKDFKCLLIDYHIESYRRERTIFYILDEEQRKSKTRDKIQWEESHIIG